MTKAAKYKIAELFSNARRGEWFSNEDVLTMIDSPVSLKTVQNVTAGLKSNGGLRSRKSGSITEYTKVSKTAVAEAQEFIF